jgi:kinesin family protein C2/C3
MFVQINSDVSSYSETLSTLKFAERVSSVELGAAQNNKEARELMEQVLYFCILKCRFIFVYQQIIIFFVVLP